MPRPALGQGFTGRDERGAMTARKITVFGGSGFIGRYVVQALARQGHRIVVAVRNPARAVYLQPLGNVGQITLVPASLLVEDSVRRAVQGAEAVVNLVGRLYEKGPQTFAAVHVEGAGRLARAAREAGAGALLHVSALGASAEAEASYARSKAAGETAVRAVFPEATIVRPSLVVGPEDDFFNRFASMARFTPVLPLLRGGATRFQPVYVGDVAAAAEKILSDSASQGQTYELGGPRVYTFKELLELLLKEIQRRRLLLPLPDFLAGLQAAVLEKLPKPPLTRDQLRLLAEDNVVSGSLPGLAELGIEPTAIEAVLPLYLDRFRIGGRYAKPEAA